MRFETSKKLLVIDDPDEFENCAVEVWDFRKIASYL